MAGVGAAVDTGGGGDFEEAKENAEEVLSTGAEVVVIEGPVTGGGLGVLEVRDPVNDEVEDDGGCWGIGAGAFHEEEA